MYFQGSVYKLNLWNSKEKELLLCNDIDEDLKPFQQFQYEKYRFKGEYFKNTFNFINHLYKAYEKNKSSFGIAKTETHFKIYCLDPSFSIKSIKEAEPKKLIFISGTLPDKETLEKIYNLKFGEENKFYLPETENRLKRFYLVHECQKIDLSFKGKQN